MRKVQKLLKLFALSLGLFTGTILCAIDCPETLASAGHPETAAILYSIPQSPDENPEA